MTSTTSTHHWRQVGAALLAAVIMATAALTCAAPHARAAQLYLQDVETRNHPNAVWFEPVCNVRIDGPIRAGDYERIRDKLREFADRLEVAPETGTGWKETLQFSRVSNVQGGFLAVCLSSSGGDLQEAFKIGSLFLNWMTVVADGDQCISACAILFMRALRRDNIYAFNGTVPGRFLHYRAKLGFHAPFLEAAGAADRMIPIAEAAQLYNRALLTIRAIVYGFMEDFEQLCKTGRADPSIVPDPALCDEVAAAPAQTGPGEQEFELLGMDDDRIPLDLMMAFLTVPPEQMAVVTKVGEAMNWGIEVYGFPRPHHLSRQMLQQACVNVQRLRCANDKVRSPSDYCLDDFELGYADPQRYKTEKVALWPVAGQDGQALAAQTLRVTSIGGDKARDDVCEVRAVWHRGQLLDVEIDTYNGRTERRRDQLPLLKFTAEDVSHFLELAGAEPEPDLYVFSGPEANRLRMWKMLPAGTPLSDLGDDPWRALAKGGDAFEFPLVLPHSE